MADINAVDLTAETLASLDGTENIVAFDTAEGKKIPISVLADYVMQKKTQTLAGETKTPKSFMDALRPYTTMPTLGNADLNDWLAPGSYLQDAAAKATLASNYPVAGKLGILEVFSYSTDTERMLQRYTTIPEHDVYIRYREYTKVWKNWVKMPTRAEMDAVTAAKWVLGVESNLADFYSNLANGAFAVCKYNASTTDKAHNGEGVCLSFRASGNYGAQVAFSNVGLQFRALVTGTWQAWKTVVSA